MLKNRRSRLNSLFDEKSVDAILVTDLKNIRYLCGFSGSDGALLITRQESYFICDSRYTAQAHDEVDLADVVECRVRIDSICHLVEDKGIERLAFEDERTTVSELRNLIERMPNVEWIPLAALLDELRICKDEHELSSIAEVAELASKSLESILGLIKPGITENTIARELEFAMRRNGADSRAFDFIVASGLRGALPHGRASEKVICAGELVTIDFGALKSGYYSDETVTVACGVPGDREIEIHSIVKEAHDRAIEAIKPGISCRDLDKIARDFINDRGYGAYFGHGLGHGVGLDVHEKPTISPKSNAVLQKGMVITIEPGIYIPGFGGVRIEDTLVVTSLGYKLLTRSDKHLLLLE